MSRGQASGLTNLGSHMNQAARGCTKASLANNINKRGGVQPKGMQVAELRARQRGKKAKQFETTAHPNVPG